MSGTPAVLTSGTSAGRTVRNPLVQIPVAVFFVNLALAGNNALVAATLYRLTGSASNFALVLVSNFAIAAIVQLIAGPIVDRLGAWRLAVVSETLACVAILVEALVALLPAPALPIVCGAALVSVVQAFYRAAMFTLSPQLAGKEHLTALNAKINAAFQAGMLLGAPIGALLLLLPSVSWRFVVLAGSFATAAALLGALPGRGQHSAEATRRAWRKSGAIRELRGNRGLAVHIVLCSGDYVSVSLFTLILVPMVTSRFGGNTVTLALVNGALPTGVILSGLLPWRSQSGNRTLRLVLCSMCGVLAGFLLLMPSLGLIETLPCVALVGFAAGSSQTLLMTALQLRSPSHILGSIASLRLFVASALSAPTLAFASVMLKDGIRTALGYCAGVEALYLVLLLVLSRRWMLGPRLLTAAPDPAAPEYAAPGDATG